MLCIQLWTVIFVLKCDEKIAFIACVCYMLHTEVVFPTQFIRILLVNWSLKICSFDHSLQRHFCFIRFIAFRSQMNWCLYLMNKVEFSTFCHIFKRCFCLRLHLIQYLVAAVLNIHYHIHSFILLLKQPILVFHSKDHIKIQKKVFYTI